MPDIAYIGKLAAVLDTDTDSLLAGDVIRHDRAWRGLLALDRNRGGVGAATVIFDKPLIYFLLSYFLLLGIRDVYVSCPPEEEDAIRAELGDGSAYGMRLVFCGGDTAGAMAVVGGETHFTSLMLVYGRDLIYGVDQTRFFQRAMADRRRVTLMALPLKIFGGRCGTPGEGAALSFDDDRRLCPGESAGRAYTQYDYSEIPVAFCPRELFPAFVASGPGEPLRLEPPKNMGGNVYVEVLDRGFVDMKVDTLEEALDASQFVRLVQDACGMEIYCLEEIAWRRGMISLERLRELGAEKGDTGYGRYIRRLADRYCGKR